LVVLISLYALAYAWLSWSAKREWMQTKKELEARGEKLSLVDFIPPPIPDEDNFYMSPLFVDMFKAPYHSPKNGNGYDQMRIRPVGGEEWSNIINDAKNKRDSRGMTNLAAYADLLRTSENKDQSASAIILHAFEQRQDLWNELYKAAEKPEARFPTQYEKLIGAPLPHISAVMGLSNMLSLRSVAYMEAGNSKDAARDIMLIFRLSDSLTHEPFLISSLVRIAVVSMASSKIWEGLERHVWSGEQLQNFEKQLALQNPREWLIFILRGERGIIDEWLSVAIKGDKGSHHAFVEGIYTSMELANVQPWTSKQVARWWAWMIPWDRLYSDMSVCAIQFQRNVDSLNSGVEIGFNVRNEPAPLNKSMLWTHPVAHIFLDGFSGIFRKYASIQVRLDMTRIACALERYKMVKGDYPEKLHALVPQSIAKLPDDVTVAAPYHYRRNALDNFTLWSVGFDGVDNNAAPVVYVKDKGAANTGDWVWGTLLH
ncbi:MAG: hypothetical protein ABIP97_06190, partial [Chthoniobacterales bacterium]